MRRDELRRAIELPAQRAGLEVEPELVDALLADVEGRPGALPLLSTALLELWQHRDGRRLRLTAYERSRRRAAARSRGSPSARTRGSTPSSGRWRARILLRLAGEGERARRARPARRARGERDDGRSPCSPATAWSRSARARSRSRTRRCCASGRGCAAGSRRTRRAAGCTAHLRDAARALGRRRARPGRALPRRAAGRGARLGGRARRRAQRARARFRRREPRGEPALAAPAARGAGRSRRAARRWRSSRARSRSTSAATRAPRRPRPRPSAWARARSSRTTSTCSLLLARQGVALDDSPQTRGNLLAALLKSPAAIGVLRGDGDRLIALDLSPDERTLAFVDNDGTLQLRRPAHAARGGPRSTRPRAGGILDAIRRDDLRFSPDGARLAVGGDAAGRPGRAHASRARPPASRSDRFVYAPALLARRAHAARRGRRPLEGATAHPALRRAHRRARRRRQSVAAPVS